MLNMIWILPRTLRLLLADLIPNQVQIASTGQYILKAARPQILLDLGVEMDHNFGSKWLVNELSK